VVLMLGVEDSGAARHRGTLDVHWWREPFRARAWKETLYLLLDLAVGVIGFTFVVTGLTVALSLLITLVGIPLLAATLLVSRWAARAELARARALLDDDLPPPEPIHWPATALGRLFAPIRDAAAWKATAYFALMLPAGIVTFTVAVTWWATALGLLTLPAWAWALPHNGPKIADGYYWSHAWQLAISTLAGALLTLAAPLAIHGVSFIDRALLQLLRHRRPT
jgi:Putative sensor